MVNKETLQAVVCKALNTLHCVMDYSHEQIMEDDLARLIDATMGVAIDLQLEIMTKRSRNGNN